MGCAKDHALSEVRNESSFPRAPSECPSWCDPAECTVDGERGMHSSPLVKVAASGSEPCSATVALHRHSESGRTMVALEMRHDPDISAALEMPTEPDLFLFTPDQAEQLRWSLARLIRRVTAS